MLMPSSIPDRGAVGWSSPFSPDSLFVDSLYGAVGFDMQGAEPRRQLIRPWAIAGTIAVTPLI